jgi:Beta-propeller repeat/Planctomycete extracellular
MSRFEHKVRWWSATTRSMSQFAPARRPHARRRLRLECLEDRTLLSLAGASNDQILQAYGQIPLSFEVNQGQTAAQVDFLSTYLDGTGGYNLGQAIAVDSAGNAYVTARSNSADFPTTAGAYQTSFGGGGADVFVAKFASRSRRPPPCQPPPAPRPTAIR